MRWSVALVAVVACGRSGFDTVNDGHGAGDGKLDGDASVVTPRCTVPARPDVSNPRITLGCDQIANMPEILNGGVIKFDCTTGMKVGTPLLVNKDTVFDGHGLVIDAQGLTSAIVINNNARLTLLDVTITRGASTTDGAGIQLTSNGGGGLVAFDSTFTENHAGAMSHSGGAIYAAPGSAATVEIYGGRFSNNSCASGGAIYAYSDLTIVNATLDNNVALGTGGDTSTGGDGGAVQFAGPGDITLCGDTFESNLAGHLGGAIVAISTDQSSIVKLTDVSLDFNGGNGGGGAYLQGYSSLTMRRVSVTSNAATGGPAGGLWLQNAAGPFDAENVSVVYNRADGGTGAGIYIGGATGQLKFSTIADNGGTCPGCVQAAIASSSTVTFVGTVIIGNTAPTTPVQCAESGTNGGANFQWPGDLPTCVTGATVTDPFFLPRANATGPAGTFFVRRPSSGSPVIGAVATGCPAEDLLGNPRPTPCAAGAVEP